MSDENLTDLQRAAVEAFRKQIWAASLTVAAAIAGEPEQQAQDALEIYRFALTTARRHGDPLRGTL
jgi:hypothetical protein